MGDYSIYSKNGNGVDHTDTLIFYVNGTRVEEQNADPEMTLLVYLRTKLRLPGTKLGCGEGGCGACTVMVSSYDTEARVIRHISVNACLAPVCSVHGQAVTTVEGIGSTKTTLHPVQERLAAEHGSQCGFCTPGFVMSMYTLLRNNPQPSRAEVESAFEGNLCRCTGYRPIIAGFQTFTKEFQCGMGEACCKQQNKPKCSNIKSDMEEKQHDIVGNSSHTYLPYDASQEPIFPPGLQLDTSLSTSSVCFQGPRVTWYRPAALSELLALKHLHPHAKLIIGNTEIGVEVKFKNLLYPVLIQPSSIKELKGTTHGTVGVTFGSATTLAELDRVSRDVMKTKLSHEVRVFAAVVDMLRWFAGHQIRNVGAISGNIMTASPISDLNPLLMAANCNVTLASESGGKRQACINNNFFTGYRKTMVEPDEVLVCVHIPYTSPHEYFAGYKQAQRREDDIAIVNAGFYVSFSPYTDVISDIRICYGGMAPKTVMAENTCSVLRGRSWNDDMLSFAAQSLAEELTVSAGTPGGMEQYRSTLALSMFFKFYLSTLAQLQESGVLGVCPRPMSRDLSATTPYARAPSEGIQVYEEVSASQRAVDPVGRPMAHLSAQKHTTGEATYCDDIPQYRDELYLALVRSSQAHARVVGVDPSAALALPGVVCYVDAEDVAEGGNEYAPGDQMFATDRVTSMASVVGAVVADTQALAQRAVRHVKVTYETLEPIVTIEEAIAAGSYHGSPQSLMWGNPEVGFSEAHHVIEGEMRVGGQEHFYLETHACIAVPKEDDEMEIFCSTQNPTAAQKEAAVALGVPANRVTVRVKRMGGGFGGKETRYARVMLPVVCAARKCGRPVRCMLDRDEDMVLTGTRHPYYAKYKVGFTSEGEITAVLTDLYSNAGDSPDLSISVMERAVTHVDNAYKLPNVRVTGYSCKTNTPSNTAFRGFGGPQAMMISEIWMAHMAHVLAQPPHHVRLKNIYNEGDATYYSQRLINCNIKKCWNATMDQCDYHKLREQTDGFNALNRWKKRGIAIIPTKYGIAFTKQFLNQGGALVHVYTDGSVLLTHGGTEMGQGLHTKMVQVASRVLGIESTKIYICETATNLVPNTSPTAASMSSDLYGPAVQAACETIMERLAPLRAASPHATWEDLVKAAYMTPLQLSATGYYTVSGLTHDWESNQGDLFSYFTVGAACSQVEIDCLTGDHTVLRTDLVMDVGQSLNPAIDVGQIEGAFMQGYGLFTLEQQKYTPDGVLLNRGPGAYKIPGVSDIPQTFNVSLLKGASNPRAVYSSKAIGEPPLFLAASIFFAIRDAITAARADSGVTDYFTLLSPATAERIRMACVDDITAQFPTPEPGTYRPWCVDL